jgi:hypothetical protein
METHTETPATITRIWKEAQVCTFSSGAAATLAEQIMSSALYSFRHTINLMTTLKDVFLFVSLKGLQMFPFLGAFSKLRKATISFVMSVCPSTARRQHCVWNKDRQRDRVGGATLRQASSQSGTAYARTKGLTDHQKLPKATQKRKSFAPATAESRFLSQIR